jgi:CHAT domain-containing protein
MRISLVLFCFAIITPELISAQCPEKSFLQKRLAILQQATNPGPRVRLNELLQFERIMKDCSYKKDSTYILLIQTISDTYYKLGDFLHAIQYIRHAIDISNGGYGLNINFLSRYYYNLNIYYDSLNLLVQKYEAIDSCIANEKRVGDDYHYTSIVLRDKVKSLYYLGDYHSCLNYASLGEKLIPRYYHSADSLDYLLFFVNYQTDALYSLGNFALAEQLLKNRMVYFLKLKNNYYTGIMYGLFAFINKSKTDYNKAIQYFLKANQSFLLTNKREFVAQMLYQTGRVYFENLNKTNEALGYYLRALNYSNHVDSVYMYGNIARIFVKLKKYDSAFQYFQKAFDKINPGINEKELLSHMSEYVNANVTEYVVNIVLDKADAFLQRYKDEKKLNNLQEAIAVYKTADHLLRNIKEQQTGLESKLFWPAYARRLYEHAIEASWLGKNTEDAFYFFERSRASILYDQLNQQSKISKEDILAGAQLNKEILMLKKEQFITAASSQRFIEIQAEILAHNQQMMKLEQNIKKRNPLYYQSVLDTSFITLNDVRKNLLKDNQILLELFTGDSAVYSLQITSGDTYLNKIGKIEFDGTTTAYINYISNLVLLNSSFAGYIETASHLYRLIFRNNRVPAGRIIISPDGNYFPFEALVTNASNPASPVYFLNDYIISYTYSARYLMNNFSVKTSTGRGNFLGIAPVNYANASFLSALQGSDLSLAHIETYYSNSHNLIAAEATRNNFLQQFSDFKIIQLYTHASDSSSHGEPVIYFVDSPLYLSDLIPENIPQARLIVLSACETGNGKNYQGEGVFSFNRAFASMGIPASITNLWSVDNKSTYRITELFYKYLSAGLPMDIALQKAKLEFMEHSSKEKKLPYYWAASILVGKSDAINYRKIFPWKDIVTILCLIGFSLIVWQKWGKSKG